MSCDAGLMSGPVFWLIFKWGWAKVPKGATSCSENPMVVLVQLLIPVQPMEETDVNQSWLHWLHNHHQSSSTTRKLLRNKHNPTKPIKGQWQWNSKLIRLHSSPFQIPTTETHRPNDTTSKTIVKNPFKKIINQTKNISEKVPYHIFSSFSHHFRISISSLYDIHIWWEKISISSFSHNGYGYDDGEKMIWWIHHCPSFSHTIPYFLIICSHYFLIIFRISISSLYHIADIHINGSVLSIHFLIIISHRIHGAAIYGNIYIYTIGSSI